MKKFYEITELRYCDDVHVCYFKSIEKVKEFINLNYNGEEVSVSSRGRYESLWEDYDSIYDVPDSRIEDCYHIFRQKNCMGYHKGGFGVRVHEFED